MAGAGTVRAGGTAFAAHVCFGLALGLLVCALARRVGAAMAITVALWLVSIWATIVCLRPVIEKPLDVAPTPRSSRAAAG